LIKNVLLTVDRWIERISFWAMILSGILIVIMAFLSTYGVGRRYLLHNPEPYSYELSTIILVACTFLSIAFLQRQGRHLRVDFCAGYFSQNLNYFFVNILAPVMALTYVGIITWQSWLNALYSISIGETSQSAWEEPLAPTKILVSLGAFILCLVLLAQLVRGIVYISRAIGKKQGKVIAAGGSPSGGS
jgi:TRAP-type mannitol/chloroaromatic compound transport system permease small subunit